MSAEGSQFRLLHDGSMWRQEIAKTNCFDVSTTINVGDLADYYKTIYLTHSVECIICGTNTNNTGCLMLFCISLVKSYGSLMQPLLLAIKLFNCAHVSSSWCISVQNFSESQLYCCCFMRLGLNALIERNQNTQS